MKWARRSVRNILPHAMEPKKEKNEIVTISIILLDLSEVEFQINKRDRGQVLLDKVFDSLKCKEPKYYGLQFPQHVPDAMKWLDPNKSIRKQFKRGYPYLLHYRIKYFVFDINRIKEPSTRYHLFLQVKLEIWEHRLACPPKIALILASYAIQSDMGDYDPAKHNDFYLKNLEFIPNQPPDFVHEVHKLHKRHRGLSPDQAELLFLQEAKRLRRFGVDIHHGKDLDGVDIEVGVATDGIGVFCKGEIRQKYDWSKIVKISFKRRQFFIQLQKDKITDDISLFEFSMENYRACKRLWKSCVDCHSFYRKEKERLHRKHGNNGPAKNEKPVFGFFSMGGRNKAKYDKAEKDILRFRSPQKSLSSKMLNSTAVSSKDKELLQEQDSKEVRRLSAPPSVTLAVLPADAQTYPNNNLSDCDLPSNFTTGPDKVFANDNDISQEPSITSDISDPLESYSDSAFKPVPQPPEVPPPFPERYMLPDDILLVRLKPDQQGRFGFNIKGGNDQNMPITVSKIATGSPADICEPKLSVGDEILQINGRDANSLKHEQAVHFIRSTREKFNGELLMLVKPFSVVYEETEYIEEVPNVAENGPVLIPEEEIHLDSLEYSMSVLEDQLTTGRDVVLFERLYRKKPDLTMKDAKLQKNAQKNRYRDISPYDVTRVKLTNWVTDYINGNHILMEISGTDIKNHYIACQGPLENTCGDFWAMIWEQKSTLIVMVTTTVERGMIKCFQYWPDVETAIQFNDLIVTSKQERFSNCFIFREFEIAWLNSDGELTDARNVSHIQYVAWPDHGVPDDSSDFLDFITCVREKRKDMKEPTVVHCSAGIGRTGVMIAVETAMCLIEANRPVFPLQITQTMRDQRAMMIQTSSQFRFVCEAILRVYKNRLSEPNVTNHEAISDDI